MTGFSALKTRRYPLPEPGLLRYKGRWIDNGVLSNMHAGRAVIRYRSVASHCVEPAYVAAKAPMTMVAASASSQRKIPFHELISSVDALTAKRYGRPRGRGGLVDVRPDWDEVCLAAMWSFQVMKYAAETPERQWLLDQQAPLVEWSNWGDRRWGVVPGKHCGAGRNALGIILSLLKDKIQRGAEPQPISEEAWPMFQEQLVAEMNRFVDPAEILPDPDAASEQIPLL